MPDARKHRGPNPLDANLFASQQHGRLRQAVADLSWLLSRGYATPSASKVVGDRYELDARQRVAVQRSACSDEQLARRLQHQASDADLAGKTLLIDGYNVLTSVEAALAGGVIIIGRDGAMRDIASMHGTWRKVEETTVAIELIGQTLQALRVARARWYLDSPVSNSGRLKQLMGAIFKGRAWEWPIELAQNPDRHLLDSSEIVATSDSVILDGCRNWFPLAGRVVERHVPQAWVVRMGEAPEHKTMPAVI